MRVKGTETIPTIELQRVVLRELRMSDAEDIYETYSDREAMKFRENPPLTSIEEARGMIVDSLHLARNRRSIRWGIEEKTTHRIIGTFLWKIGRGSIPDEIGYSLNRYWWKRGIMTEVVEAMTGYLFNTGGVSVIIARAHEENLASVRLLEKLGFVRSEERLDEKITFRKKQIPEQPDG